MEIVVIVREAKESLSELNRAEPLPVTCPVEVLDHCEVDHQRDTQRRGLGPPCFR